MWSTNQARATRTSTPKSERKKSAIRFPIESKFSPMRRNEAEEANAPHPTILHEYQNKRLTKFAIRKWLILKDAILVVSEGQENSQPQKRKAGACSRTPDAFF